LLAHRRPRFPGWERFPGASPKRWTPNRAVRMGHGGRNVNLGCTRKRETTRSRWPHGDWRIRGLRRGGGGGDNDEGGPPCTYENGRTYI
jgi:hypothetical protein